MTYTQLDTEEKLTAEGLVEYFHEACRRKQEEAVGVEYEKLGVLKETGEALPYEGPVSILRVLEMLIRDYGWEPEYKDQTVYLKKAGRGDISLEPGGQLELSTPPSSFIDPVGDSEERHLEELREIGNALGIHWLGLGLHPVSGVHEIPWVPKERYLIMREYFKGKGEFAHSMMKRTSSIQVTIDYLSEYDAIGKVKLAMKLAPVLTAMFANSCISEGRLTGYKCFRSHIWMNTDRDRCGIIRCVFNDSFSFREWADYALDVPMFFIEREGRLIGNIRRTFRSFLQEGYLDYQATLRDWELHLTCIFPEVRLRKWIEIRSADRQVGLLAHAVPVLVKMLLYDKEAREAAGSLLGGIGYLHCVEALREAAQKGLEGSIGSLRMLDAAAELLRIADGVSSRRGKDFSSDFEIRTLDLLKENILERKICPSDSLIASYRSSKDLQAIIRQSTL